MEHGQGKFRRWFCSRDTCSQDDRVIRNRWCRSRRAQAAFRPAPRRRNLSATSGRWLFSRARAKQGRVWLRSWQSRFRAVLWERASRRVARFRWREYFEDRQLRWRRGRRLAPDCGWNVRRWSRSQPQRLFPNRRAESTQSFLARQDSLGNP